MMNVQIDQLVKSLLQKDSLDQCSLQELQQYADRHPYFGAAQLLLTKKLQTENSDRYQEQLQKTFLFFHNPLWVEHLLNDSGSATITPGKSIVAPVTIETENAAPTPDNVKALEPVTESNATETEFPAVPAPENVPDQPAEVQEKIPALPEIRLEPVAQDHAEMLFQPYHTVDYFASQGIKMREEAKPTDKFGQQLKSFTDWLKTMKRLPATEITQQSDPSGEHKVEQLAEHSIEDREVLTEAMAEVWEKQKNHHKAVEIYRKLSLLDPSKSAYFAAKIEDLKKLN